MKAPIEPVWMTRLDKYFWPILYILVILSISVMAESAQAQDRILVDRWRLEKACRELILLDSITKDSNEKDSVIRDLKELDKTRLSDIETYKGRLTEKSIQLNLSQETTANVMKENLIWKSDARRYRRQRNASGLGAGLILALLIFKQ